MWANGQPTSAIARAFTVCLVGLMITGCVKRWEWFERTTVTVQTPHGAVSGSSVADVYNQNDDGPFSHVQPFNRSRNRAYGEATVIDLGPEIGSRGPRYLFALREGAELRLYGSIPGPRPERTDEELLDRILASKGRVFPVKRRHWPEFVAFDDPSDPATVRYVDPDDLGAVFGPGVRLRSITVGVVDGPATAGIVRPLLPWLDWSRDRMLARGGGRSPLRVPFPDGTTDTLNNLDFVWERPS